MPAIFLGEGHQLCLGWISLEAILVEPLEDLLISFSGGDDGNLFHGGGGIDGSVIHIEGHVAMHPLGSLIK